MRLIHFEAKNVHGYLNFDIKFHEEVTFLIGINGTGKTSVLKIILGLISPSYKNLNQIEFEFARLQCWDNESNNVISIEAKKVAEHLLELSLLKGSELFPTTAFIKKTSFSEGESPLEENEKFVLMRREFESQSVVQEIKKMSTPIFLGLDRRIYEGKKIDRIRQGYINRRIPPRKQNLSDTLDNSLFDLQTVLSEYYRQLLFKKNLINEQFRNQIISSSFEFIDESQMSSFRDLMELAEKRETVIEAISQLNMEVFLPQINSFFDKMEETQREVKRIQEASKKQREVKKDGKVISQTVDIEVWQKWFNNQPQLKKINDIIELSKKQQAQMEILYEPMQRTINIINSFLSENKKTFRIEERGEMLVGLKNGNSSTVYSLSSGEKQIITIIGHLIFFEEQFGKEPGVFIIDEPELSLHLAWQEIFVSSLIKASPKTQLILATHSPSIIENYDSTFCEDLAKLN